MQTALESNIVISDKIKAIYREIQISPIELLRNYAVNQIVGKIQKYAAENEFYKDKYKFSYDDLGRKVDLMENEENFEWEDDLMDWRFAVENLSYWQKRLEDVRND